MKQKNIYSKLLRIIASTLDNLSEEELENLLSGKGTLVYKPTDIISKTNSKETPQSVDTGDILNRLNECQDREKARAVLSEVPNKETLTTIAKSLKVHVVKYDRREDIENKIIEFLIGAKLRTEAIHSLNMKGGKGNDENG
jgi:hypothetical protein